jgi:hypothetical protein
MLVQFTGFDPEDMQFVPEAEAKASAPDAHRKYIKQQESLEAARRGELTTSKQSLMPPRAPHCLNASMHL